MYTVYVPGATTGLGFAGMKQLGQEAYRKEVHASLDTLRQELQEQNM